MPRGKAREPKATCRGKWAHKHLADGLIEVRKRGKWVVTVTDDGSICDRDVEPAPVYVPQHWFAGESL
jgi:hypothetical protein